jgi:hypothetical protein
VREAPEFFNSKIEEGAMKVGPMSMALFLSISSFSISPGAMAQALLVTAEDLKGVLPQSLDGYTVRERLAAQSSKSVMTEAVLVYVQRGTDAIVRIDIADMINNQAVYDYFISTAQILQANASRVVEALAKRSGDNTTVQQAVTGWGKKALADLGIETLTVQSVGSMTFRASTTAPAPTPAELIDQWSIFPRGELTRRFGDVPLARVEAVSGAAIALRAEHPAFGLGIDFSETAARAKESGRYFFLNREAMGQFSVGLTEETETDGAYAKLFSGSADVAGWEIYDPEGKYGALLLGVGGRFAVLVEGVGIDSIKPLKTAFGAIALDKLNAPAAQ